MTETKTGFYDWTELPNGNKQCPLCPFSTKVDKDIYDELDSCMLAIIHPCDPNAERHDERMKDIAKQGDARTQRLLDSYISFLQNFMNTVTPVIEDGSWKMDKHGNYALTKDGEMIFEGDDFTDEKLVKLVNKYVSIKPEPG